MRQGPDSDVAKGLLVDGLITLTGEPETGTSFTITQAGLDLVGDSPVAPGNHGRARPRAFLKSLLQFRQERCGGSCKSEA